MSEKQMTTFGEENRLEEFRIQKERCPRIKIQSYTIDSNVDKTHFSKPSNRIDVIDTLCSVQRSMATIYNRQPKKESKKRWNEIKTIRETKVRLGIIKEEEDGWYGYRRSMEVNRRHIPTRILGVEIQMHDIIVEILQIDK